MTPILFSKTATTFNTNGIGRLECISCVVTEERNGIYELEAVCPVQGNHVSDVEIDSIIAVIPFDGGTIQGFRVYEITKPLNGKFTVYARHISYQLLNIPTSPFNVAAAPTACATTLANLKSNAYENCPFTFWTNVTTGASYSQTVPSAIRQRLLGTEGSVLDQFGGEYEWDNWTVKLHNKRGTLAENNGIVLRYGKNITDIEQEENISNVVTGVVPFWADNDGNVKVLPNKEVVYSQYANRYPFKRTIPLDLSDKWDIAPTESALRTAAQAYVNNSDLGVPRVSIEVSFVALWQSEEYKDVLPLQRVKLCDEITVIFEKYGIERVAKIVKTEYDVLKERYRKIQVGDMRSSFAVTVNDMNSQAIITASEAVNNATKWLLTAGGYVVAVKNNDGSWKELLFVNNTNPSNATQGLRINNNGIGFWNKAKREAQHLSPGDMWNGPYDNAWTIDGNLIADFIHGGTLKLGGNNNGNGWLKIMPASGDAYIGKWDVSGIEILKGDIKLGTKTNNAYPFQVTNAGALTATDATISGTINASGGSLGNVTVNSLKLGNTTWTGTQLDDRLAYILSVAQTAQNAATQANSAAQQAQSAASQAQSAADTANSAAQTANSAAQTAQSAANKANETATSLDNWVSKFAGNMEKINSNVYSWFQEIWADGVGHYHDPIDLD